MIFARLVVGFIAALIFIAGIGWYAFYLFSPDPRKPVTGGTPTPSSAMKLHPALARRLQPGTSQGAPSASRDVGVTRDNLSFNLWSCHQPVVARLRRLTNISAVVSNRLPRPHSDCQPTGGMSQLGSSDVKQMSVAEAIDNLRRPSAGKNEQGPTAMLAFLPSMAI